MANKEQLAILKLGVDTWNKFRQENPDLKIDLNRAHLSGTDLSKADLNKANLSKANLSKANLSRTDLSGTNLSRANLSGALLSEAYLSGTDLSGADLSEAALIKADLIKADLSKANLSGADLSGAHLIRADLSKANLSGANLSEALLGGVNLSSAKLNETIFNKANFSNEILANTDLSESLGLLTLQHSGPSSIGTNTLIKSKGKIPPEFLRQCGLSPWEIEFAKLYNPDLTPAEISDIVSVDLFQSRTHGPLFIGGIFISYSHKNSDFVDKIEKKLKEEEAAVWRDIHGLKAGLLYDQIKKQIRICDILLIVLSEASINSDWVVRELKQAREKEKEENRVIICPIALDDSWVEKKNDPPWDRVTPYNILDFSAWKTKKFSEQFQKLVSGLKENYTVINK